MLVLSYLGPFCLIPLVLEKNDPIVQWHSKHGLVLLIADCVTGFTVSFVGGILALITGGFLFGFVSLVSGMLGLAILILHVLMIVKAVGGERLLIPHVSIYADRF